ncbi:MAG: hypothetical protein ILP11_01045 [Alphaproteobacteria bacterium]|nr:hypothetical protein [Alphaproteobacteria bacterium]
MTEHVKVYGVKPRIQYTADGSLTTYEFPFAIFSASDLDVYFGDSLQDTATYTIAGVGDSDGGSVTFAVAPAADTIITIVRNLSIERTSDFQEGATLRAKVLNDELDYQVACQQQIADTLNRSMVLPPYAADSDVDLTLPLPDAGKAIVWNADGTNLENSTVSVNALESTLNGYKTAAESAAGTATNKASEATTQAGIATAQADIATTKAGEAALAAHRLDGISGNCITQIPQDIKLELDTSTGYVTLKAGSKLYRPNGADNFDVVTIESDIVRNTAFAITSTQTVLMTNGTTLFQSTVANNSSGTTAPTNGTFYNTSTNTIKQYSGGAVAVDEVCFPLAIITTNASGFTASIDKVFNGMGYFGGVAYALPNVKGLIPNGRNEDGTLKNTEFVVSDVLTRTTVDTTDKLVLNATTLQIANLVYDEDSNTNTFNNAVSPFCIVGNLTIASGKITAFTSKTAFQAVDFNDKTTVSGWGMPNYAAGVSRTVGTQYTAGQNGWVKFYGGGGGVGGMGSNGGYRVTINGTQMDFSYTQGEAHTRITTMLPVSAGTTYQGSLMGGATEALTITWYPCIGG